MESFETVKDFIDYVISDDEGWKGIRDDAPESAKKAWERYIRRKEREEKRGIDA